MITKAYTITCEGCMKSEALFGQTLKECKEEAKRMGWTEVKRIWKCEECQANR